MKCIVCAKSFSPKGKWKNIKFCSSVCRGQHWRKQTGRESSHPNIASGTVGAISELAASVYFLSLGYAVFRALSPACFCDIVAFKENETPMFIEVRTGYKNLNGNLSFSKTIRRGATHFAVVIGKTHEVFIQKI
jgi:hypothetical protein